MKKEKWGTLQQDTNYLISSWGRVFSFHSNKFIRPYIHKSRSNNYLRVCLSNNKKYMLHFLVAYHFVIKGSGKGDEVNHKDRNTLNCNAENLEWNTPSENTIHMYSTSKFKYKGTVYG